MKNGMIRIGMFEAYLERMLIRGLKVAYISYFTRTLQEAKAIASTMCTTEQNTIWLNNNGPEKRYNVVGLLCADHARKRAVLSWSNLKCSDWKRIVRFQRGNCRRRTL